MTKYEALYRRMKKEQALMVQISRKMPKGEKVLAKSLDRYRRQIKGILKEISEVRRELSY